jgi:hypothetical protein
MSLDKFTVPTELIELPSQGKVYDLSNHLSSGSIEMKYMTAREEDILTNINLLRQGIAIDKMLQSLIKSPINYEDLTLGDRNALFISARILAYGKDYTFSYKNPTTGEDEQITIDLQTLKFKEVDLDKFNNSNEVEYTLPYSKNTVTFKILTVADDKKIDEEIKGIKKTMGQDVGVLSTRLKFQLLSINGDRSTKSIREFVDKGYLLSRDSLELRKYIASVTPDIDTKIGFTTKTGEEVTMDLPMSGEFFFPGVGI